MMAFRKIKFPLVMLLLVLIILFYMTESISTNLSISLISIIIVSYFLFEFRYPITIGYVFLTQWLSASMIIVLAGLAGTSLDEFYILRNIRGDIQLSTMLSIISAFLFALGLMAGYRAYQPRRRRDRLSPLTRYIHRSPITFVAATYAISYISSLAGALFPALGQVILPFANLKWVGVFALSALFVKRSSLFPYWLALFVLELVLGFSGFFSGFRTVFIYALAGMFFSGINPKPIHLLGAVTGGVLLVLLSATWSVIKPDFRDYLNQGSDKQVVLVSPGEAISEAIRLMADVDGNDLAIGFERLGSRIAYTQYFGAAILYVPAAHPHTSGKIWLDAILRPIQPRILFPNKEVLDDSVVVRRYTGIQVPGREQGAQIALGYPGESYVDFGAVGMFIPIIAWSFFIGLVGKIITFSPTLGPIFGSGLAVNLFLTASEFRSPAKQVGSAIGVLIVYLTVFMILKMQSSGKNRRPYGHFVQTNRY